MTNEPSRNSRRSLVGLVVVAALFAGVWYVMTELRRSSALQACFESGRRDCVTIDGNGAHPNR